MIICDSSDEKGGICPAEIPVISIRLNFTLDYNTKKHTHYLFICLLFFSSTFKLEHHTTENSLIEGHMRQAAGSIQVNLASAVE